LSVLGSIHRQVLPPHWVVHKLFHYHTPANPEFRNCTTVYLLFSSHKKTQHDEQESFATTGGNVPPVVLGVYHRSASVDLHVHDELGRWTAPKVDQQEGI
jgi:hypothetical protein